MPPAHRPGLADRDVVAATREVVGGGEPRRARANDQHPLAGRLRLDRQLPAVLDRLVTEETLDAVDAHRVVYLRAVARRLARVVADASHHGGQRVVLDKLAPGRLVVAGLGVVEPLLDVLARRGSRGCMAACGARRRGAPAARSRSCSPGSSQRPGDRERLVHHARPFSVAATDRIGAGLARRAARTGGCCDPRQPGCERSPRLASRA